MGSVSALTNATTTKETPIILTTIQIMVPITGQTTVLITTITVEVVAVVAVVVAKVVEVVQVLVQVGMGETQHLDKVAEVDQEEDRTEVLVKVADLVVDLDLHLEMVGLLKDQALVLEVVEVVLVAQDLVADKVVGQGHHQETVALLMLLVLALAQEEDQAVLVVQDLARDPAQVVDLDLLDQELVEIVLVVKVQAQALALEEID